MLRGLRHSFRLLRIGIALSPMLWRRRKGVIFARSLERMGPAFIKLGQVLSTRADIVGEDTAAALGHLRDRLPPFKTKRARRIIAEEFGRSAEEIFQSFEPKPVAAASIAQVHFATMPDGSQVAVKILRPNIEKTFARDLDLFFWIAEKIAKRKRYHRLKPIEVVRTLAASVRCELDLRFEAAAATEMRENLAADPGIHIPAIDWQLTSQRVMVMERITGIPIHDIDGLKTAGHNLDAILEIAGRSFFNQVLRDGFFHADLHPGNLFVEPSGHLAVIDFGITGRIDRKERYYLAEMLRGFLMEDYKHVAWIHIKAGYVPSHHSVDDFAQACMAIGKPLINRPMSQISIARLLAQLFKITEQFEMETQPQLLLLQKTMMLTEGVGRMLNPNANMWENTLPLVEHWAREHLGPKGRIKDFAADALDLARKAPELMERLDRALSRMERGEMCREKA